MPLDSDKTADVPAAKPAAKPVSKPAAKRPRKVARKPQTKATPKRDKDATFIVADDKRVTTDEYFAPEKGEDTFIVGHDGKRVLSRNYKDGA